MILPTWEEAQERCVLNNDTPLDRFIYDNEPAGRRNEAAWRFELVELCDYLLDELHRIRMQQDEDASAER